ncbi:hypothetical protein ACT7DJ_32090 [Bacillus cereus]
MNYYSKAQSVIETASVLVVMAMARVTGLIVVDAATGERSKFPMDPFHTSIVSEKFNSIETNSVRNLVNQLNFKIMIIGEQK